MYWITLHGFMGRKHPRPAYRALKMIAEGQVTAMDVAPAQIREPPQYVLHEILQTLSPEERLICSWENLGFSSREIARRTGLSPTAVERTVTLSKEKIARALKDLPPRRC
jgi:DNA-directed RNA polymerase specialized sigma24 family protein